VALGLTQLLTEMSTRNILWGKGGRCVGLTTLLPSCVDCLEIWAPETAGIVRNSPSLYRVCFIFLSQETVCWKRQSVLRLCREGVANGVCEMCLGFECLGRTLTDQPVDRPTNKQTNKLNSSSASQTIPCTLWNSKVQYRIQNSPRPHTSTT